MTFDLIAKMNKNFPPLDIAHMTVDELLHLRMVGLSNEEEKEAIARAKELGMLHHHTSCTDQREGSSSRPTDNTD